LSGCGHSLGCVPSMGIRVIFDESRASVTSPVPYTNLRCAERRRPGIKMRFIEDGMSVLGQKLT
jgi:hypothetical protein